MQVVLLRFSDFGTAQKKKSLAHVVGASATCDIFTDSMENKHRLNGMHFILMKEILSFSSFFYYGDRPRGVRVRLRPQKLHALSAIPTYFSTCVVWKPADVDRSEICSDFSASLFVIVKIAFKLNKIRTSISVIVNI